MSRVKAVILAAGLGTRLRPLTDHLPKCLVPLGPAESARPILDFWLDLLGDVGVREILINSHVFRDQMHAYISSRTTGCCRDIFEAFEPTLLGSAGTIAANRSFADDASHILILYADNLSSVNLREMLGFHRSHDDPFTMMLFRTTKPTQCGIAELDDEHRVVSFVEKPREPVSDLASAGVYIVDADAYREIAALNAFDFGHDVLPHFVGRMRGWEWGGYHRDIGTLDAYEQAQKDVFDLLTARGADAFCRFPAVFLDRDGTLIEHEHYIADPSLVRILPGVHDGLAQLRSAGYRTIVVSNQSAVGRGVATHEQLNAVNRRMCELLARQGAVLDAIYTCTDVPTSQDRTEVQHTHRKPGPGMLFEAARDHHLDLARSWMVGDMISDVLAGYNAGCRGSVLVDTRNERQSEAIKTDVPFHRSADFSTATAHILAHALRAPAASDRFSAIHEGKIA